MILNSKDVTYHLTPQTVLTYEGVEYKLDAILGRKDFSVTMKDGRNGSYFFEDVDHLIFKARTKETKTMKDFKAPKGWEAMSNLQVQQNLIQIVNDVPSGKYKVFCKPADFLKELEGTE